MAKRGTKQNPYRLQSLDGAARLHDDDYVLVPTRDVLRLQEREPIDSRPSNHRELQVNDPEVPATMPNDRALDILLFGKERVSGPLIRGRRNIADGVVLSDREKLVLLATNCLTPAMERQQIAAAMKITFNEVRSLRWHAEKLISGKIDGESGKDDKVVQNEDIGGTASEDGQTVVLRVKVLRVLQGYVNGVAPAKREVFDVCAEPKQWNPREAESVDVPSDYRELHRLYYGKDPVDDVTFQNQKYYLGSCVRLSDKQLLVVLSIVSLTKPIGMYALGRAMGINKNHVLLLRKQSLKIMNHATPSMLIQERLDKARKARPQSPLD